MKPLIIVCFLTGLISCSVLSKNKPDKTPPGTVWLTDDLFIDKTEIANIHWREFLFWILHFDKDTVLHEKMLPDTSVWQNRSISLTEYYFRHPGYNYYPVVGISYEQAEAFCNWRSDRVNELYQRRPQQNPFPGKKYRYRLPTKEEWEYAAAGKLDTAQFPYGRESVTGTKGAWKGHRLFNYLRTDTTEKDIPLVVTVDAFLPNAFGLYNMIGNVSEIITEKGAAKGGNYTLPLQQCRVVDTQYFTGPEVWLGFRCVCEVID